MAIDTGYANSNGEVLGHASRMVEEAGQLRRAVSGKVEELHRTVDLSGRVQRNPFLMVAAAAGVGYVLGGGLFSPATGRLVKVGMRLALVPFLKGQLERFAADAAHAAAVRSAGTGSGTPAQ